MTTMDDSPRRTQSAGPVAAGERIEAIDTLRGFALLGILVMNITAMAFPMAAYFSPMVYGGRTGLDLGAWVVAHLFFELKMMGIFSMLFGAGVVFMWQRAEATGRPFGRIYYRRVLWLLLFGLVHGYLVWHGDILVTYAICGLLLFLFRRRSVRALVASGLVFLLIGSLLSYGGGVAQGMLRDVTAEIEEKVAAGEEMTPRRQKLVDQWQDVRRSFAPTDEEIDDTITIMRGDAIGVLRENAHETVGMHTEAVPFMLFWRGMALMLIGMGMMKAGVFTGESGRGLYWGLVAGGVCIGLPLVAVGILRLRSHGFDFISSLMIDGQFNYFASVLVSLGYVGAVMLVASSGALPAVQRSLAAVGRMALTNYLLQSLLGVALFYGYGLALFGEVSRFHLWWFILGIWAVQLWLSPWWLARFRFGPAEWVWRSLTYWRRQTMRIES